MFPEIDTWQTGRSDLVLVASKRRRSYDAAGLARRIADEPFKSALSDAWRAVDIRGLLAHYVANDSIARAAASDPSVSINSDDRNVVEFGFARLVGQGGVVIGFSGLMLLAAARAYPKAIL